MMLSEKYAVNLNLMELNLMETESNGILVIRRIVVRSL